MPLGLIPSFLRSKNLGINSGYVISLLKYKKKLSGYGIEQCATVETVRTQYNDPLPNWEEVPTLLLSRTV